MGVQMQSAISAININNPLFYVIYALVVVFILSQATFYLIKSLRRAKAINMDMKKIGKVISSSILFSILPSVGIVVGIVTLIGAIGIALPSIRLSIIGSLQYEAQVVSTIASKLTGHGSLSGLVSIMDGKTFVTIVTVMTAAIVWGPLFCLFFYKKLQQKTAMAMINSQGAGSNNKKSGENLGTIIFAAAFVGMVLAYLSIAIGEAVTHATNLYHYYNLISVAVAALIMMVCDFFIEKLNQKWLENFSLAFAMLGGMGVVALISYFYPEVIPKEILKTASIALGGIMWWKNLVLWTKRLCNLKKWLQNNKKNSLCSKQMKQ